MDYDDRHEDKENAVTKGIRRDDKYTLHNGHDLVAKRINPQSDQDSLARTEQSALLGDTRGNETARIKARTEAESQEQGLVAAIGQVICKLCELPFQPKRANHVFCNQTCWGLAQRKRVEKTCLTCGDKFEVARCLSVRRKFCSKDCLDTDKRRARRLRHERICQNCNSLFKYYGTRLRKFCSKQCQYRSMQKRVIVICSRCGKKVETARSNVRRFKFCSKKCVENKIIYKCKDRKQDNIQM
jgi:endogenous inhibitor of DNA gyrase (YacG/DUF329 family)